MKPNKNGDVFPGDFIKIETGKFAAYHDDSNNPPYGFAMTNAPKKTPVAHMNKDHYEKLVRSLEQLMGRDACLSRNCTDIECPNALLCLTTKMVPIKCSMCGKRLICDANDDPLQPMAEFEVPEGCTGYEFVDTQQCSQCRVQTNVHRALESFGVPVQPPTDIEYDSNTGICHVTIPMPVSKIDVKIDLGDE